MHNGDRGQRIVEVLDQTFGFFALALAAFEFDLCSQLGSVGLGLRVDFHNIVDFQITQLSESVFESGTRVSGKVNARARGGLDGELWRINGGYAAMDIVLFAVIIVLSVRIRGHAGRGHAEGWVQCSAGSIDGERTRQIQIKVQETGRAAYCD